MRTGVTNNFTGFNVVIFAVHRVKHAVFHQIAVFKVPLAFSCAGIISKGTIAVVMCGCFFLLFLPHAFEIHQVSGCAVR